MSFAPLGRHAGPIFLSLFALGAHPARADQKKLCDALLAEARGLRAEISAHLALEKVRHGRLAEALGDAVVQKFEDLIVARHEDRLFLMRESGLRGGDVVQQSLIAPNIDNISAVGDFVVVETRHGKVDRYLQIFTRDLKNVEFGETIPNSKPLRWMDVPGGKSRLLQVGSTVILVPLERAAGRSRSTATYEVEGEIVSINANPFDSKLPVISIDYNQYGWLRQKYGPEDLKRRAFFSAIAPQVGVEPADALLNIPRGALILPFLVQFKNQRGHARLLLNMPGVDSFSRVETWTINPGDGVRAQGSYKSLALLDPTSIKETRAQPFQVHFEGTDERRFNNQRRRFTLLLNDPSKNQKAETMHLPLLLPEAQPTFGHNSSKWRMLTSDQRVDRSRVFSRAHDYRHLLFPKKSSLAPFAFDTSLPLTEISNLYPFRPRGSAGRGRPRSDDLIFARVENAKTAGYLIICPDSGQVLWMPGLHRIDRTEPTHRNTERLLFWGEQRRENEVVPLLAIFEPLRKRFVFSTPVQNPMPPGETLKSMRPPLRPTASAFTKLTQHLGFSDDLSVSIASHEEATAQFHRAIALGGWGPAEQVHAEYHPAWGAAEVRFERGRAKDDATYVVNVEDEKVWLIERPLHPEVVSTPGTGLVKVWAGESFTEGLPDTLIDGIPGAPASWKEPLRNGRKWLSGTSSHALVKIQNGADTREHQLRMSGRLDQIKFERPRGRLLASSLSTLTGFTRHLPVETRWDLSLSDPGPGSELIDPYKEPLYEDDEITVLGTRGSSQRNPEVLLRRRDQFVGERIDLARVQPEGAKEKDPLAQLIGLLNQQTSNKKQNTAEIGSVRREGDLIFVTTKPTVAGSRQTFVYNMRKRELAVVIPNLVTIKDRGGLRFYVGEADHTYPTIVAVFNKSTHEFQTFFDFGRVKLDLNHPEAIVSQKNQILFRTSTGARRAYDVRLQQFRGLLPASVATTLKAIDGPLGSVLNTTLFRDTKPRLHERDDLRAQWDQNVPLTHEAHGANHVLVVAPPSAGVTASLEDKVIRYISGEIGAEFSPVFFLLSATDATADTSYRGTKSDKYKALREVAQKLREENYRLIVISENMERRLPNGERTHFDEEGDFFSALREVMEGGSFDLIGTTTPVGLELLQRQKPDLANKFNRVMRIEPMSRQKTTRAIGASLNDRFGPRTPLREGQVNRIVERVDRLSTSKVLPGAAFDVTNQLLSKVKTPRRGRAPVPITDAAIDQEISQRSGVPAILLDKAHAAENARLMEAFMNNRVKGVPHLVKLFVTDLFTFALETNRPDWPISRILAMGPTGTGKTELIKAALDFLSTNHQVRLLISGEQFLERESAARLIKLIVTHVAAFPFNVLQLDEFEKMHPDCRNIVLSLADGEITGADGRRITTTLTVIYATSNLGVEDVRKEVKSKNFGFRHAGEDVAQLNASLEGVYGGVLERELAPEVRNRFDRFFIFPFLLRDVARVIATDYLNGLDVEGAPSVRARFLRQEIDIVFDDSVIEHATNQFVDYLLGARRLAINIENEIVKNFLTHERLAGRLRSGGRSFVSYEEGQLRLRQDTDHAPVFPRDEGAPLKTGELGGAEDPR